MLIHYQPGDKVTVTSGPLKGAVGTITYTSKGDWVVLVIKGKETEVLIKDVRPTRATIKKAGVL